MPCFFQEKTTTEFKKLERKLKKAEQQEQKAASSAEAKPKRRGRPPKVDDEAAQGPEKPSDAKDPDDKVDMMDVEPFPVKPSTAPAAVTLKPAAKAKGSAQRKRSTSVKATLGKDIVTPERKTAGKRMQPATPQETGGTPADKLQPKEKELRGNRSGSSLEKYVPLEGADSQLAGGGAGKNDKPGADIKVEAANDRHTKRMSKAKLALQKLSNLPACEVKELMVPGPEFHRMSYTIEGRLPLSMCKIGVVLYTETFYIYGSKEMNAVIPEVLKGYFQAKLVLMSIYLHFMCHTF